MGREIPPYSSCLLEKSHNVVYPSFPTLHLKTQMDDDNSLSTLSRFQLPDAESRGNHSYYITLLVFLSIESQNTLWCIHAFRENIVPGRFLIKLISPFITLLYVKDEMMSTNSHLNKNVLIALPEAFKRLVSLQSFLLIPPQFLFYPDLVDFTKDRHHHFPASCQNHSFFLLLPQPSL